jgi:hypothetical protein
MSGLRWESVRKDIDYVDCDRDSLADNWDFLTPTRDRGFLKKTLTNSLTLYYRFESHFIFYYVVLSFDSQGAYAPRTLPILLYWHDSIFDIWETLGDDSD